MSYSLSNIKYISNNPIPRDVGKSRDEKEKSKKFARNLVVSIFICNLILSKQNQSVCIYFYWNGKKRNKKERSNTQGEFLSSFCQKDMML